MQRIIIEINKPTFEAPDLVDARNNAERRNIYEVLGRAAVGRGVTYIEAARKLPKPVPPQRVFRYLQDVPTVDLMVELEMRDRE